MKWLLATSLIVAIAALSIPWIFTANFDAATHASVLLAISWIVILAVGIRLFGKRGLWLLIGMPMALYWPLWFLALIVACASNRNYCP